MEIKNKTGEQHYQKPSSLFPSASALAKQPEREFNVREFARLLKISPATASKQLKEFFPDILDSLEAKAKATSNPIDDIFVIILRGILG